MSGKLNRGAYIQCLNKVYNVDSPATKQNLLGKKKIIFNIEIWQTLSIYGNKNTRNFL